MQYNAHIEVRLRKRATEIIGIVPRIDRSTVRSTLWAGYPVLDEADHFPQIRKSVARWINNQCTYLQVNDVVHCDRLLDGAEDIESIRVSYVETYPSASRPPGCRVDATNLIVLVYEFEEQMSEQCSSSWTKTRLPCSDFDIWHEFHMDGGVPQKLVMQLHKNVTAELPGHIVLLHGPPGTGKTSLCRALAQKLAISAGERFTSTFLLEAHVQEMFSNLFGQSAKLVAEFFSCVKTAADDDERLVCVLFDELETVGFSRKKTVGSSECVESLRVTNELLRQFDLLRPYQNVIVLCTTNLLEMVDLALVDRAAIVQYIGNPDEEMAYNILRSNIILASNGADTNLPVDQNLLSKHTSAGNVLLTPSYAAANVDTYARRDTIASKLLRIATLAAGKISGRRLSYVASQITRTSFEQGIVDMEKVMMGLATEIDGELRRHE